MNNKEQIVLNKLSAITGLPEIELSAIKDMNLFENGILDSLSISNLLCEIEDSIGIQLDISHFKIEKLQTINSIVSAIDSL